MVSGGQSSQMIATACKHSDSGSTSTATDDIYRVSGSTTSDYYSDTDDGRMFITYCSVCAIPDECGLDIEPEILTQIIINREKCRWILRIGPKLRFNPLTLEPFLKILIYRRLMRCNRHGLGLRIRIKK